MEDEPGVRQTGTAADRRRRQREEFRSQVSAARADFGKQARQTRARLDATNERIEARTGRNLVSAIAIGVLLGALVVVGLAVYPPLFMAMAAVLTALIGLELARALRLAGRHVPVIPVVVASLALPPAAFFLPRGGTWILAIAGIAVVVLWRLVEAVVGRPRVPRASLGRDLGAIVVVLLYGPYLASFAVLLLVAPHGAVWLLAAIIVVVVSDVGAYATGLALGRHPMAPTISPKKTWEGFAGAAAATALAGIITGVTLLGVAWWVGLVLGIVLLVTATAGDLAESLVKRDIGIKDMSSWLPGHGGFLDRLDSILPSMVAAYVVYLLVQGA